MKLRPSALVAIALLVLAIVSLFLPWLRLARADSPASLQPLEVARQLAGEDDSWVHHYLFMRGEEWRALAHDPFAGASLVQALRAPDSGPGPGMVAREWASVFLGPSGSPFRLIWFTPTALALAFLLLLLPKKPQPQALWMVAALAGMGYFAGRIWAHHLWSDRVLMAMELGIGWWLSLYGLVLLALVAAIRAAAGPKAKW